MGLDDLLARLERAAGTAGTADVPADVPANPLQTLAGTAGTAGTAEKDKGGGDSSEPLPSDTAPPIRATRWLLHYADRDPVEVWFAPAVTHAEVLAAEPGAVAAEPVHERVGTRPATSGECDELLALVEAIYADDTEQDRQEAIGAALLDPAGALACYRAITAERGITAETLTPTGTTAAATGCKTCRHCTRPGRAYPGYCGGGRADLLPAYGEHHPLRKLPDDGGATCASYTLND